MGKARPVTRPALGYTGARALGASHWGDLLRKGGQAGSIRTTGRGNSQGASSRTVRGHCPLYGPRRLRDPTQAASWVRCGLETLPLLTSAKSHP